MIVNVSKTTNNNASALPPSITVNGSSNAVVAPGAKITVAVANGPGNPKDWVGLYAAGQPDNSTNFLSWVYLNGTQTAPSTGVKSATVTMAAPSAGGSYEARFYANDGYTVLARTTFSVQASAPPPPPPSSPSITVNGSSNAVVAPGASIAVAVANGPGNPTDWVGLYVVGAPDNSTNFLSWVYLNGTQTAPSTGVKSATVTMAAPSAGGSYEARFYANDGYTVLARTTFSVQASAPPPPPPSSPSITVNGSSNAVVAPGASIAVAVANGPGNPTDWVGLYVVGAPDNSTSFLSWVYLNDTQTAPSTGVKSATVTMAAPSAGGSYEARFYANDGYTVLARTTFSVQASAPPPPPPSSPSITVNGSSNAVVAPGASIAVAVANGPGNPTDWVGLYVVGAPDNSTNFLSWVYLNGTQTAPSTGVKSATVTMAAPSAGGSYEARFYANDGYTVLARTTFSVQASAPPPPPPSSPSITVNGSSNAVVAPGAKITVAVANGPGNPTDWVGLYVAGAPDNSTNFLSWVYLNGTQTAPSTGVKSATVTMTAATTNGSYEARFYANDGYTVLARATFSVQASAPPPPPSSPSITVNGSSNAVVAPGAKIRVAVANGPGNPTDWVGLYVAGAPDNSTNFLSWVYLNGTQTAPSTGVKSATVTMTAATTNGSYEARFYANDGYTVLARATFSVQASAPPPPPSSPSITVNGSSNAVVAPGAKITVAVANGPGNPTDWVGLYVAGAPDNSTSFLSWVYLNGKQIAPSTGVKSATVTMAAPSAGGSYEARFYANDGYTLLARTTFSVQASAPPPPPPSSPSITVNGSSNAVVAPGASIAVAVANGPGNPTDWVGLYVAGAPDNSTSFLSWVYLNGKQIAPSTGVKSATVTMAAPSAGGSYEARFYANDGYTLLARTTFSVQACAPPPPPPSSPSITVNGSSNAVVAPGASIAVAVANGPGNPTDWVGLYVAGAPDNSTSFLSWVYLNGKQIAPSTGVKSATVTMAAPSAGGSYEARFYANDGYTLLARTTFSVQACAPPPPPPSSPSITVNGSSNAVVAPGASIAVAVANGPGNPTDWVGLYVAGAPDNSTSFLSWVYLNGKQIAPSTGVKSATVTMAAPSAGGSYEARFYANDGYTLLARTTFSVQASAPPPPPPSSPSITVNGSSNAVVAPGASIAVAVANGPGNPTDWVGLYVAGAPDNSTSFLSWVYLNGKQIAPSTGVKSATVTMAAPSAGGSYEARFYANDGYTLLARTTFSVQACAPPPPPPSSPSITVNGSSNAVVAPGASIAVAVANGPGNPTDWVGLYVAGAPDNSTSFLSWVYLNGKQIAPSTGVKSATVTMAAPSAGGSYEARFYANDGYTLLARTTFSVQASAPPPPPPSSPSITVNGSSNAVVAPGASIAVAVANGPGN